MNAWRCNSIKLKAIVSELFDFHTGFVLVVLLSDNALLDERRQAELASLLAEFNNARGASTDRSTLAPSEGAMVHAHDDL